MTNEQKHVQKAVDGSIVHVAEDEHLLAEGFRRGCFCRFGQAAQRGNGLAAVLRRDGLDRKAQLHAQEAEL